MNDLGLLQPAVAFGHAALLRAGRHWHVVRPIHAADSRLSRGKRQQAAAVHGGYASIFAIIVALISSSFPRSGAAPRA